MGQLKTDGRAIDVTWTASQIITKGDLYRQDGWNGIALEDFTAAETPRASAMEVSSERIWLVKTPAGVGDGARGDRLYWTTGAGFKRGDTDLSEAVLGSPVAIVEELRDANGWCGVRVLNV